MMGNSAVVIQLVRIKINSVVNEHFKLLQSDAIALTSVAFIFACFIPNLTIVCTEKFVHSPILFIARGSLAQVRALRHERDCRYVWKMRLILYFVIEDEKSGRVNILPSSTRWIIA